MLCATWVPSTTLLSHPQTQALKDAFEVFVNKEVTCKQSNAEVGS